MKEKAKYIIVEDYIKNQINEGKLKPGDQLDTEVQLAEQFNVSRLTINKAISRLAFDGLIERIPGKGSFVKQDRFTADYKTVGSFTKYIESQHRKAGSRLLEYKAYIGKEVPTIANLLDIGDDEIVHYFVKVRTVEDEPVAVMTSYVPAKLVPNFDISVLSGSLYEYFDSLNLPRLSFESRITAILPDEYLSRCLEVDKYTALLKHTHVTYTRNHIPLEYCEAIYIGNKYAYEIEETRAE